MPTKARIPIKELRAGDKAPTKSELDAILRRREEQEQQKKRPNWRTEFEDGVVAATRVLSEVASDSNVSLEQATDALIAKAQGKKLDKSQEDIIKHLNSNRVSRKAYLAKADRERKSGSQGVFLSWAETTRQSTKVRAKIRNAVAGGQLSMVRLLDSMEWEIYTFP